MNRTLLKTSLVKHEGLRLRAYIDSAGKITVGVGRNLTDVGVSDDEVALMLDNDINKALAFCQTRIECFGALSSMRQNVLIEMAFNLGGPKLMTFSKMFAALERRDFASAAAEMQASEWAHEVGVRAAELAALMEKG